MHENTPHRYSRLSAFGSSTEVPRTPSPNQQNRSPSLKPMRVLGNGRAVLRRPEVVSPTPAGRAYALRYHRKRRKGDISQAHRLPYKPFAKTPGTSTLVTNPKAPTASAKLQASNRPIGPGDIRHGHLAIYEDQTCTVNQTQPQSRVQSCKNGVFKETFRVQASARSIVRLVAPWGEKPMRLITEKVDAGKHPRSHRWYLTMSK